jgi:hypothetical protein
MTISPRSARHIYKNLFGANEVFLDLIENNNKSGFKTTIR